METVKFAKPKYSQGTVVDIFFVGDRLCTLIKDSPTMGAENIPKELQFKFPYCLFVSDYGLEELDYMVCHEISMFGTSSASIIDHDGNRESIGAVSESFTPERFIRFSLWALNKEKKVWDEGAVSAVTRSLSPIIGPNEIVKAKGFLPGLGFKSRNDKLQENVRAVLGLVWPYVTMCNELSINTLAQIKQWDVSNERLTTYIAYLRGVVSTVTKHLYSDARQADIVENSVITLVIKDLFEELPLAKYFIDAVETDIINYLASKGDEKYGRPVYFLGNDPMKDIDAMMKGNSDYVNFSNNVKGFYTQGLAQLGFVRGKDFEEKSTAKNSVLS